MKTTRKYKLPNAAQTLDLFIWRSGNRKPRITLQGDTLTIDDTDLNRYLMGYLKWIEQNQYLL